MQGFLGQQKDQRGRGSEPNKRYKWKIPCFMQGFLGRQKDQRGRGAKLTKWYITENFLIYAGIPWATERSTWTRC